MPQVELLQSTWTPKVCKTTGLETLQSTWTPKSMWNNVPFGLFCCGFGAVVLHTFGVQAGPVELKPPPIQSAASFALGKRDTVYPRFVATVGRCVDNPSQFCSFCRATGQKYSDREP